MDFTKTSIAIGSATLALAATLGTSAFAQSSSGTSAPADLDPAKCAAAMDAFDAVLWPAKNTLYAAEKTASQKRTTAMKAALSLDDDARKDAAKAAMEDFREEMDAAHETFRTATATARETLRDDCAGAGPMMMGGKHMKGPGGMGMGPMKKMMKMHRGFDHDEPEEQDKQ